MLVSLLSFSAMLYSHDSTLSEFLLDVLFLHVVTFIVMFHAFVDPNLPKELRIKMSLGLIIPYGR